MQFLEINGHVLVVAVICWTTGCLWFTSLRSLLVCNKQMPYFSLFVHHTVVIFWEQMVCISSSVRLCFISCLNYDSRRFSLAG